jgi:putative ABC transport system permease protein
MRSSQLSRVSAMAAFEQFRQDAVYAARTLKQSPGFAVIASLTLFLGIGCTTALFSVLNAVLLRSLPYHEPSRLVHVLGDDPSDSRSGVSWRAFEVWKSENGPFSQIAAYYRNTGFSRVTFGGTDEPESMQAGFATASFFTTMGMSPSLGRVFDDAEEHQRVPVAVLSASLWARRFGFDPRVIGRTVDIDGRAFTVIGVMPREFQFPARDTQLWVPITTNRFWGDQPLRDGVHTRGYYMRWNVVADCDQPSTSLQRANTWNGSNTGWQIRIQTGTWVLESKSFRSVSN